MDQTEGIYLDYAATSPMRPEAKTALTDSLDSYYHNPSAAYAGPAKNKLAECRQRVATILQVQPSEVVFTAGATEANSIAINGALAGLNEAEYIVGPSEHDSIASTVNDSDPRKMRYSDACQIDIEHLRSLITARTALVSLMLVSNETGIAHNVKQISQLLASVRQERGKDGMPLWLHVDASQAGYVQYLPHTVGADMLTLNGSKIGGPKQSGCLFVAKNVNLTQFIARGVQERGLRPGTEALHQIEGFTAALEQAALFKESERQHVSKMQAWFEAKLTEQLGARVVAAGCQRSPHITIAVFSGSDNERLMYKLAEQGIYVGLGSACHASSQTTNPSLRALGLSDSEQKSSLRFSYSYQTTLEQLKTVIKTLKTLL